MWVCANLLACASLAQAPAIRLTTFYETWPGEAQFALGNNPDDLTPDFAWDARTASSDSAWTAELRYSARDHQTWGVIVHRVYPRELTHLLFSVRMPRGTSCFL